METISQLRSIAERSYAVEFAADIPLPERVLWPTTSAEEAGMEDARFVRFVHDDGSVTFYATYTAYSGSDISQQLLETADFRSFTSTPLVGRAAANKGLALFPRRIGGRFAAMSRSDRESNSIAYSDNPFVWTDSVPCQRPAEAWEALQLGNCGPPIETEAGWLVLTHGGVGPMRTYRIGAILLDLEDPTRILGRLRQPLLSPAADEQDGYVPQRRLLLRSAGARRDTGAAVRNRRLGHRCRDGVDVRTARRAHVRDLMTMKRVVGAELGGVGITAPSTLEFQIAIAPHPGTEVYESLSFVLNGKPVHAKEISGTHGNRIHKLHAPVGYLEVDYSATIIGQTAPPAPVTDYDQSMYLRPSRYAEADKFYGFAATEFGGYLDSTTLLEKVSSWVATG